MSNSLSLLEASFEESNADERGLNAYGSLVAENEARMSEDETDDVVEVSEVTLVSLHRFIFHTKFIFLWRF